MAAKHDTPQHRAARKAMAPLVNAGLARCCEPVCLVKQDTGSDWIQPGTPWDAAHDREASRRLGRDVYRGPAHARCNRSEGASYGNRARRPTQRRWVL
jgi:hypothetical protein